MDRTIMTYRGELTRRQPQVETLRIAEREALDAARMVADPLWNKYCEYINKAIAQGKAELADLTERMLAVEIAGLDDVVMLKNRILVWRARIEAWEQSMQLVKDIAENGTKARDMLARIGPWLAPSPVDKPAA